MKDFKEILLEKLKVSGNTNNYNYESDYWNRDTLEHMLTFIIYDDEITDSFFDNNPEQKIPESCLSFYPEDEEGNDIDFNGLYEYCKGKNLREIPFEEEDMEELFGTLDYNDRINLYYYFNSNNVKTIIYESRLDGSWYYSIFGDKEINKVIDLFPNNLVEIEDDRRSLLQAYEFYLRENR
jgi:hypothetical protein